MFHEDKHRSLPVTDLAMFQWKESWHWPYLSTVNQMGRTEGCTLQDKHASGESHSWETAGAGAKYFPFPGDIQSAPDLQSDGITGIIQIQENRV